ncbi:MAG: phosphoribosylamine--glycine ligase [Chthoniobacterales bacterium]
MKVLVIGGGGREHALAWKIRQSPRVSQVFVAPGNAGTQRIGRNVPIKVTELAKLRDFALDEQINLTVVGPDDALAAGAANLFEEAGLRTFGPRKEAARLESSKGFAKSFMVRHGIPTPRFAQFDSSREAIESLDQFGLPVAIKADGLALGKGVVIAHDRSEAEGAIGDMIDRGRFGEAGRRIVIEEFLTGTECSVHALVDGRSYLLFPTAQDHKQLYDGNHGPNTGGMGAFSPSNKLKQAQMREIEERILKPFVRGIQQDRIEFRGLLFPGLMLTPDGLQVLEFNCRFGDPEAQAILPRLESDLVDLLEATLDQRLDEVSATWSPRASVCVVMASGGYPDKYLTGKRIVGIEEAEKLDSIIIFHAGTKFESSRTVTSGGRVLGITALGDNLLSAKRQAYDAVEKIEFDGSYFRRDIALR